MKHLKKIAGLFFFFLFCVNIYAQVEKLDDGVLIHLPGANPKAIKLEVISDRIIHVITSPVGAIQKDTSLMVIAGNKKTDWSVTTKNNETTLSTTLLKVVVELSTGRIKFHDLNNQPLLEEDRSGSSFTSTTIDGGPLKTNKHFFLQRMSFMIRITLAGIIIIRVRLVELLQQYRSCHSF
jgi:hypothetical protein